MADYKVIFRDESPKWQEICPVLIEAIQVARDTQSSNAFLQFRIRNISDRTIGSVALEAKVLSPDGSVETAEISCLDADVAPNAEYRPSAYKLSCSEVTNVEAIVTRVDDVHEFAESIEIPPMKELQLSSQALEERTRQLAEFGYSGGALPYAHQNGDGWWICSCGTLNLSNAKCRMCGIRKDALSNLENEKLLEEQGAENKYLAASKDLASDSIKTIEGAKDALISLGDYKDSSDLIEQCDDKIAQLKKGRSKKTKVAVLVCAAIVVVIAIIALAITVLIPSARVNEAMEKAREGNYDEAIAMLKEYDETDKITEVNRMKADAAADAGSYDEAIKLYKDLGDNESAKRMQGLWADGLFADGSFDEALNHYREASDDNGILKCAVKFSEAGEYAKAIGIIEPLASKGVDGAQEAVDEAKYEYIKANYNSTDETTCKYLLELKGKGYKDTQALCDSLYVLSATSRGFENKPIRKYNNVTYYYTIDGCMPGGLDDRTVSVYDSVHNESKQKSLKYGGNGSLLMSQLIDGGAHSATITITDDATGTVLLEETISF